MLTKEQYERAWLAENRAAGLGNVSAKFDNAIRRWVERDLKYQEFRARWARDRFALPPEEIGIPRSLPGLVP